MKNLIKVDFLNEIGRERRDKDGIKYDEKSFNDCLKDYIENIDIKYIEYIPDYDILKNDMKRYITVDIQNSIGKIKNIDKKYVEIELFDEYKDINPLNYYATFRIIGKHIVNEEGEKNIIVSRIITIDLINR